jgi:hypothetical protein
MAKNAPKSIDGIVSPSIIERSHGVQKAPLDAAEDGRRNGLTSSSKNIAKHEDVGGDDQGPWPAPVGCAISENPQNSGIFGFTRQEYDGHLMAALGPQADRLLSGSFPRKKT